jgi:hypothetical protein
MCDGKRVDEIDSRGVATARACRVVTGVSRKDGTEMDEALV